MQGIPKKSSENFADYFLPGKNGMTESVSTLKLFCIIVMHSKPLIEKISICYYVFVVKSQILKVEIKLNFNQFSTDFNSCFTETYLR